MFYEQHNSLGGESIRTEYGTNFSFPYHLHENFELITVTEGSMTVGIGEETYTLEKGNAVLVFPNQVHCLSTKGKSSHFLCIFSPKLVRAYSNVFNSKVPKSNMFYPDESLIRALMSKNENILYVKGVLYTLCAAFDKTATYCDRKNESSVLLYDIFKFVEENFDKDCSLCALSEKLSYNYVYLSKYFKDMTGMSFTEYVCRFRISEGCYLLHNSSENILKIAYECGFDSLRSFNRNFKAVTSVTPSEYRDGK